MNIHEGKVNWSFVFRLTQNISEKLSYSASNWESPPQFEKRIKPRVYIRCIARSTMYKKLHFVSRNWCKEN